jgi:hypothetical protein
MILIFEMQVSQTPRMQIHTSYMNATRHRTDGLYIFQMMIFLSAIDLSQFCPKANESKLDDINNEHWTICNI